MTAKKTTAKPAAKKASKKAAPKASKKAKGAKPAAAKQPKEKKERKPGLLTSAAQVLAAAGKPMRCTEMVQAAADKGLWTPPAGGKTPERTLSAAILREIAKENGKARFKKGKERGTFVAAK